MQMYMYILSICAIMFLSTGCTKPRSLDYRNPDDIVLEAKEIGGVPTKQGDAKLYQFSVNNVPKKTGKKYEFFTVSRYNEIQPIAILKVDPLGELIAQYKGGTRCPLSSIKIVSYEVYTAEPVDYYLLSLDGDTCVSTRVIPHPICTIAQDGAEVSIVFENTSGKDFTVQGKGFLAFEQLDLEIRRVGTSIHKNIVVSQNGTFQESVNLTPTIEQEGRGIVEIKRAQEALNLEFDWGNAAFKYSKMRGIFSTNACFLEKMGSS